MKSAIILVGHGGAPTDFPKDKLSRLKRLEGERMARGGGDPSPEEEELDRACRHWPRTLRTEPYKFGLEAIARDLSARLGGARVEPAYNEFCAPSLEEATERLAAEGFEKITYVTTMFTRGGLHSECEIPYYVSVLRKRHPGVTLEYKWPFDPAGIADFLALHLSS